MDSNYFWGVLFAIVAGITFNLGWVLQKKVVNEIQSQTTETNIRPILIHKPLWLFGAFMTLIPTIAFFLIAQSLIGPALVPGLMSAGYIVLIIGTVKIIKTRLTKGQILGIILIVLGVIAIGASQLQINLTDVDTANNPFLIRTIVYSIIIFGLWQLLFQTARKQTPHKALLKALSSAFPFCLSDFWVIFALAVMSKWGDSLTITTTNDWILWALGCGFFIWANLDNVWETQVAFQYGDASVVIPIQQVPTQNHSHLCVLSGFSKGFTIPQFILVDLYWSRFISFQ